MNRRITLRRESNFESLRILAMALIVVWHLGLYGLENQINVSDLENFNQFLYYLIKSFSAIAVNLYVMISGYFLCKSSFKWRKVIRLIFETFTFSILIYLTLIISGLEPLTISSLIKTSIPIFFNLYWFVTVYLVLFILSPYLNIIINNIVKKQHFILLIILFVIDCIWQFIYGNSTLGIDNGFGLFHFVFLYIFAAFIRNYGFVIRDFNKYFYLFCYIILALLNATANYVVSENVVDRLYSYNYPLIVLMAYSLFMYFKQFTIRSNIINTFSKSVFGIYLIHEHPMIRQFLWNELGITETISNDTKQLFFIKIIGFSISIFLVCWLISFIISSIFNFVYNHFEGKLLKKVNRVVITNSQSEEIAT